MKLLTNRTGWVAAGLLVTGAGLFALMLAQSENALISIAPALRDWPLKLANFLIASAGVFGALQERFPLLWSMGLISIGLSAGLVSAPKLNQAAQPARVENAAPETDQTAAARQRLDGELSVILNLIQSHLEKNKSYSAALARGQKELASAGGPKQVRAAILFLIAENQKMLREVETYKRSLEESKSQINALRTALAETQELSARDSLTGAYTRRHFDSTLTKEIGEAKRKVAALSLIMADIDDFKKFNDTYGHLVGDEILKGVAKLLSSSIGPQDTVARFGGEEFAILLPRTPLKGAVSLAEDIRGLLKDTKWRLRNGIQIEAVTASFGVAELNPADSPEDLLQRADAKLYVAKSGGRNRVISDALGADS